MRSVGGMPLVAVASILLWVGCDAPVDGPEVPSAANIEAYSGTWEYRYGDSPRLPSGDLAWAGPTPAGDDVGWQPTTKTYNPPGRNGRNFLWLRTRLPAPKGRTAKLTHPVLHITWAEQNFEAFLDGQRIDSFAWSEPPRPQHFPGFIHHYLPLSEGYGGKLLVLRLYSPHVRIGLPSPQYLGEHVSAISQVVRTGLGPAMVGALLLAASLALLALYLVQRSELDLLLYSLCLLSLGVYMTCRSSFHSFLVQGPVAWYAVELSSLCLIGAFISLFANRILGPGRFNVLPWLSLLLFAYFIGSAALVSAGLVHLASVSEVLKILLLLAMLTIGAKSFVSALRGDLYGRIFCSAFVVSALMGILQILQELRLLPRTGFTAHYTAALFALMLGSILLHRFRAVQRRLADLSTMMQLNFASARDVPPEEHAQLLLSELVRMLQADCALLFTCADEAGPLTLYAARWPAGTPQRDLDEPIPALCLEAQKTRHVATRRQRSREELRDRITDQLGERMSEVAEPLLARGQLLGVLYLRSSQSGFGRDDSALLQGLSRQIALLLLTAHANTLEQQSEQAQKLMREQEVLLTQVGCLARGDLDTPIAVPVDSQLTAVSALLEGMRKDLRGKMAALEGGRIAVQELNDDLRFQIEERIQQLLEQALSEGPAAGARGGKKWLEPGDMLAESYRVISILGQGASGCVYQIERTTDGRHLAAKVISAKAQKESILQFAREAQILARVTDPHVTSIVDVDITDTGSLFLVMELVQGTPLSQCLDRYREFPRARALLWQIASGLTTVHRLGVIHRDLKPANILVADGEDGPQAKLVDFGVSTLHQPDANIDSSEHEQPGLLLGSPMYLAPELVVGSRDARPPADVFSFGVVAFEVLTSALPFEKPPVVSRYRGEALAPTHLASLRPDVPPYIVELLERCLSDDPARRPTAAELVDVLAPVDMAGGGLQASGRPVAQL